MYYPKSQIKPNLYTNGNEFVVKDTYKNYIGYYFKTSTNEYFTGKTPMDGPNNTLIYLGPDQGSKPDTAPEEYYLERLNPKVEVEIYTGGVVDPDSRVRYLPTIDHPHPTDDNYRVGSFPRYFAKKINGNIYLEINKTTFNDLNTRALNIYWEGYVQYKLFWQLQGTKEEVARANKNSIDLIEHRNRIIGLGAYLDYNYTQYYRTEEPQNNLFTDGTEFKNRRTGVPYSGPYHIHPENGPMVGATHISSPHDYLDPITPTLTSSQMTPSPSRISPSSPSPSLNRGGGGGY